MKKWRTGLALNRGMHYWMRGINALLQSLGCLEAQAS